MDKQKTYVTIVLDRSGSMSFAREATVRGLNEQIETIQDGVTENNETIVSVITFASDVRPEFVKQAKDVSPWTLEDYNPRGNTAMYDAVGFAIESLQKLDDIDDENASALVVIISDGQENASTKVSQADLAEKIQALQDTGRWTFSYMGANQDLSKITKDLNLYAGNVASFNTVNVEGYSTAYVHTTSSLGNYMSSRSAGQRMSKSFYVNEEKKDV